METLQVFCKTALANQCSSKYIGMAFDGCYFYLTCPDLCKIVKYDICFCEVECFNTIKPYNCICYDSRENCFWVSKNKYCNRVFKLNCHLNEIDSIILHSCECCDAAVTGLSYDCNENRLLVSFANCIISISTSECQCEKVIQKSCPLWNTGVCSVSPDYMAIESKDFKQNIAVYDCNSKPMFQCEIPFEYFAETIIFNPCPLHCDGKHHFYILATKSDCYSYVLECTLGSYALKICDCNYDLCNKNHCEPPEPSPSHSCNDIIESIALIEASLSHILNAEGEKLQKIIASTDDVEQILRANEAINDTIVKITHLEIILYDKLAIIKNYCCNCDEQPKSCEEEKTSLILTPIVENPI